MAAAIRDGLRLSRLPRLLDDCGPELEGPSRVLCGEAALHGFEALCVHRDARACLRGDGLLELAAQLRAEGLGAGPDLRVDLLPSAAHRVAGGLLEVQDLGGGYYQSA